MGRLQELLPDDRTILTALLFTILGLAVRLYGLTDASLWYDELYSLVLASSPVQGLLAATAADVHPPLYYLLLKAWTMVFGSSELALRLPSAIIGAATIYLLFIAGRQLIDDRTGLIAAGLLTISPLHIYWSQQARGYTLFTLLVVVLTILLLDLLEGKHDRAIPYIVIGTALVYLHHFAWLFIGTHALVAAAAWWQGRASGRTARRIIGAIGGITALWLPWSIAFLRQASDVAGSYWVPGFRLGELERTVLMQLGNLPPAYLAVPLLVLGLAGLVAAVRTSQAGQEDRALTLLTWLIVPPLAILVVSVTVVPLFYHRFFQAVLPATLLVVAYGARTLLGPRLRYLPALGLAALTLISLGTWTVNAELEEDWRATAGLLDEQVPADAAVVFHEPLVQRGATYYGDPVYDMYGHPRAHPLLDQRLADLDRLHERYDEVWVVLDQDLNETEAQDGDDVLWDRDGYERVVEPLEQWYEVTRSYDMGAGIRVFRLQRRP